MEVLVSQIIIGIIIVILGIISYRRKNASLTTSMMTKMALLMMLAILLGSYLKLSLPLFGPETFEIKFDTLPILFIGVLFGPWWGFLSGFIVDMVQLMLSPTSFPYLGFTLNLMATGMLAGIIFEKKQKPVNQPYQNLNQWLLFLVLVLSILFIILTNQVRVKGQTIEITHHLKWGLVAIVFFLFFLVYLQYKKLDKSSFTQRWIRLVVISEMVIHHGFTVIWLNILFKLPYFVSIPIRLIEAPIMIAIYSFVGGALHKLIEKIKPF